ncbi:putative leucine-rich repeat receptor-like serine/threonine-protein kinase At2g14440 isoform X2 [Ananas comosus]|uniref:Leucine-rich repeat receptor-like serine/threonine-protein kinase At2g14440 isoform X2 n=1 Tax=Ananas comosus TaxID=4615 RepID=A0A6P5ERV7_ANACO|nr:putative leucine-rich repeat receptor-like serine/threonine-protein kinase At2g14440 isoform X2 [Ananas comosus]
MPLYFCRLLFILSTFFVRTQSQQHPPPPKLPGLLLDCGTSAPLVDERGLQWFPDGAYIGAGAPRNLSLSGLFPTLSTLRSFPFSAGSPSRKYCYVLPAVRRSRYLVRTTYFYGGVNGAGVPPPVFDQIVDGTFWTAVNTTQEYAAGMASYYEGVFLARGKTISVCVAGNAAYTLSDPFISALEFIRLPDSVYNATDFNESAMGLIARTRFGSTGLPERYPDDRFDRYWHPLTGSMHAVGRTHNITVSEFWNIPPADVFDTAIVADQDRSLVLQWPSVSLPNSSYYIALYFADTAPNSSRTFNVFINDYSFYSGLTVTSSGLSVFSTKWILSGLTTITLTPGSTLPPLINAGELFGLFSLGKLTYTRDVINLENIKRSIKNPPEDWNGDPCMPRGYSWTGVTCFEGSRIRVVALNLSSMGLSGFLSPSIDLLQIITFPDQFQNLAN